MADIPDAIDTPITAGELSDDDLVAPMVVDIGVAGVPVDVTVLGNVVNVVMGRVVAAVAVAVVFAVVINVLLSDVLLTTTVVGVVDTPVLSAETGVAVAEAK
jgi:hypothetical protein